LVDAFPDATPRKATDVTGLDGTWHVRRTSGLLPPLFGVRKTIDGDRGETQIGPFPGVPFTIRGNRLRYRWPFHDFVDILEPDGERFRGRAFFRDREYGRFSLVRAA
jgi:hypothetical protein